jgi:acetylornithine aminotransferase
MDEKKDMKHDNIIPFYKQIDKVIVRAKDCYLYDTDNNQYIDFEAGDWAAFLGHSNKQVNKVLKKQADTLIHDGLRFRNRESEELSALLLDKLLMNDGKCMFLNSGSEAVNCALTLAKHLTGRSKILKIDCTYLSAYGYGRSSTDNSDLINIQMDHLESIAAMDFSQIAAFAFEPGNSWCMIRYPSNEFIKILAQTVKQNGGLLIANEVTTGIGRTGKWFGFQHYDFSPDIVSVITYNILRTF